MLIHNHGSNLISVSAVEDYPYGYPRLSSFLDSDDAFKIYRRFGTLRSRVLLCKQDELRRLESDLELLDFQDNANDEGKRCLRSWKRDAKRSAESGTGTVGRASLLQTIETKLMEYGTGLKIDCLHTSLKANHFLGQLMAQAQQFAEMRKPTARDHASVMNYMDNEAIVAEADKQFIYLKDDLVTLRSSRDAWLDERISNALGMPRIPNQIKVSTLSIRYTYC